MKILKERFTKTVQIKLPILLSLRLVVLSLCVLLPAGKALAQTEKKISYPVAVPIVRAATASSISSTPALKAPTPIIRSLEEAGTPPVRSKAAVVKSSKSTVVNKAKNSTVNKKAPTAKTVKKSIEKTTKDKSAKKLVAKKVVNTKPVVPIVQKPTPLKTIKPVANSLAAPIGVALATLEEEQEFARSLGSDENFSEDTDSSDRAVLKTATTVASTGAVKTPLPMGGQREAFVTNFKNFVETKLVPRVPGLALAVIADGKVKVLQTYGVRKVGTNNLVNADTTFRLASVSKSFGATAAALMVNDGLITWDTKVTSVLPDVEFSNPRYGDQLTVQNILSQSTGLPTQTNSNFIEDGLPFDEIVRRLRYVNFVCPPGKCYNYQNVTYSLISNIVLKKTGITYEKYLENRLFKPLGMRTATVGFAGYNRNGNYAEPHIPTRKSWAPTTVTEHYYRVNPAAGVNASISDMSRWVLAHMGQNPTVLPPAVLNAVHSKITRNTPAQNHYGRGEGVTDSHYGLGWRVFDYRGDKNFVHHGGGVKGFRSEVVFNPELKIGMVILTNGARLSGSVIFEFLDAYEDEMRGERKTEAVAPVKKKK